MAARLYDRATGQWVDVEDKDVDRLVSDGSHAFERGVTIPVVGKDGELYDLPSENAEAAFREGAFKWTTPELTRAFEDRKSDQIMNERAGGAGDALVSGIVRGGTFGLSDKIIPALVGDEEFAKEALNRQRQNNPGAAIAGEIVGSLIGAPAAVIKGAKGAHSLLREAGAIQGIARAETAVGRVAQTALEQAGEGAVYGLGQGISEAALGDPDEVAQNLASSTLMGTLFGGAFGAAFGVGKEIAPEAKAFISKRAAQVDETVREQARKAVAKAGSNLIESPEGKEVFKKFAMNDEGLRTYLDEGGDAIAAKLDEDYDVAQKVLDDEAKQIRKGLESHIDHEPHAVKKYINEKILPQADGDIQKGLDNTYDEMVGINTSIDAGLRESGALASKDLDRTFTRGYGFANRLRETGESKAVKLANKIESVLNAELTSRAMKEAKDLRYITAAEERRIMLDLRQMVEDAARGTSSKNVADLLNPFKEEMTRVLHKNQAFGLAQRKLDETAEAYNSVRGFLTNTNPRSKQTNVKQAVLDSIMTDKRQADRFNKVFTNISEIAPEMEAFRKAGKDAMKRMEAIEAVHSKLNKLKADRSAMGERLSVEDIEDALVALDAKPDLMNRLERLKQLQETLRTNNATPASNMLAVLKAVGHPISELQEKVAERAEWFRKLDKHFSKRHEPGMGEKLLRLAIKRPIRSLAGLTIGGMFGDTTGAIVGTAAAGLITPNLLLKNLSRIERVSQQASERATKATAAAIDALTSNKAKKLGTVGLTSYASLKDARKNFKDRADYTIAMAKDPEKLLAEFENRFGDMQETPALSSAMMRQFAQTAQFLESKLPKDPLAHQYLSGFHSKWQPSDYQLAQYQRYVRAAEDPISVVEDLARGKATPEAIETLRTLNPIMFRQLQEGVTNAIMEPDANPSYKQKLMIGTLFDLPADPTLTANFIATMQSTYSDQAQSGQAPQAMNPQKSVHINISPEAIATETSRITNA